MAVAGPFIKQASADGSRMLLYLPGAVMVNREPLDLGAWPDLGPYRTTRAVLSAAYGVLQVCRFEGAGPEGPVPLPLQGNELLSGAMHANWEASFRKWFEISICAMQFQLTQLSFNLRS